MIAAPLRRGRFFYALTFHFVVLIFPVMNPFVIPVIILAMLKPGGDPIIPENPSFTLPDDIAGWATDDRGRWDAETLYRYINGGAELFLSHGFDAAASRRYARDDQPEITVDIFRMQRPQDAFAVYSLSREREDGGFGQGAQVGAGLLLFWKHRYFVSIIASPQTPESREAVRELARRIDEAIPETGPLPDIVTLLPADGRRPASVRHFRHHAWQNVYGFISSENILGIGDEAPAAAARYDAGGDAASLLLISYPGRRKAEEGFQGWCAHYRAGAQKDKTHGASATVRREDRWYTARRSGEYLLLVHDAPSTDAAESLIDQTLQSLE